MELTKNNLLILLYARNFISNCFISAVACGLVCHVVLISVPQGLPVPAEVGCSITYFFTDSPGVPLLNFVE